MEFKTEHFKDELVADIRAALSFVAGAQADVAFGDPVTVKSMLSASRCTIEGEFMVGDIDGTITLAYRQSGDAISTSSLTFRFDDSYEILLDYANNKTFIDSLTASYGMYLARKKRPRINLKASELLRKIKDGLYTNSLDDTYKLLAQLETLL